MGTRAARGAKVRARAPQVAAPLIEVRAPAATIPGAGIADLLLQRMAAVVIGSGVGVVRGRADRGPRWANEAFLAMSGYTAHDLPGLDWAALMPGETMPPAAAPGAIAPTCEKELARADGSRWPVIVSRGLDPTDPAQLILFVVDLTASRVAEAARRAADSRYARFFEVSNVVFWTADAHGRATLSSTTTADRLGSDVELDSTAAQAELVHPDDRALAAETWEGALATGEAYDIELRTRGLDGGDFRWTRLRAFPDRQDGEVVGWYGITEDIHERRVVADALLESEQRFKRLADDIPVMVWLIDADQGATYMSKTWYDYTGQSESDALGQGWLSAVKRADLTRLAPIAEHIAKRRAFDLDFRVRGRDGNFRWMLSSGRPRFDASGALVGYAGALTDIHARKVAERQLEATQLRLSQALDGTGVGVWEWDAATDTVSVSGSALGISGIATTDREYSQVDYVRAVHPEDRPRLQRAMAAYVAGESNDFTVEIRIRRNEGGWVWVLDRGAATGRNAQGRATHMVGTLTNIEASKRAEERLRWTADHDALTGLAARPLFQARLATALATGAPVALALLDIDDFKGVNDVLGHAAGDALLTVLAERLARFADTHETVARLGGDEFTLVMPGYADAVAIAARLEELRACLSEPFMHDGKTLTCRSSIGVALAPQHGTDASSLLKAADSAMYRAKAERCGAVAIFDPEGHSSAATVATVSALSSALEAGRIDLRYEPIVRLATRHLAAFETLPCITGGPVIDIHAFDAVYGDPALMIRLGETVAERVLADLAAARRAGRAPEFVAINVSLAELRRADYADGLLRRLAAHDLPPSMLRIEILETCLHGARAAAQAEATLAALSRGGVMSVLDSFGVGASSLSHLARLPLAAVKIDAQFIASAAGSPRDQAIVRAILGLANSFGLRSAGLGIETEQQAALLHAAGCVYGQGPLFGAPRRASEI